MANFDVTDQSITPYFPYTGNWYDLMDENGEAILNVTSTNDQINLQPGEFKIYGNQASTTLSIPVSNNKNLILYPNPATNSIALNNYVHMLEVYDVTGKILLSFNDVSPDQQLNINKLAAGYYVIKIYNEASIETRKLIVR